jgi:hypothetical protein
MHQFDASMKRPEHVDMIRKNNYYPSAEVDRSWWASWTSNPVTGRNVRGGFDSHALPPIFLDQD